MKEFKTVEEYDALASAAGQNLVEFRTAWCPVCKKMEPVLDEAEKQLSGRASFSFIDAGAPQAIESARKAGVMAVPTFILFRDGKEVFRHTGSLTAEKIAEILSKQVQA